MSKLIKIVFGTLIFMAFGYEGFAQHRVPVQPYNPHQTTVRRYIQAPKANPRRIARGGNAKVQAVKEDFIGKQMNLTPQEAKEFWPLYRKYTQELTAVRILKRINNTSATTDGARQVDLDLKYESQMLDIKKRYRDEFYKILPPEKVSILYKSEHEFNDEVMKQLVERSVRAGD
ncbi:MAG TPA: hypothetical protein VIM55_02860 [Mucilaginibacter sp.]